MITDEQIVLREGGDPVSTEVVEPVSIVMILDSTPLQGAPVGTWLVFEGTIDPIAKKFKVVRQITGFPANIKDPDRPPTVAVNFAISASRARGLSLWIP